MIQSFCLIARLLKDAADCIVELPKTGSNLAEWQAANEALTLCSRDGYEGADWRHASADT